MKLHYFNAVHLPSCRYFSIMGPTALQPIATQLGRTTWLRVRLPLDLAFPTAIRLSQ